MKKLLAMSLLVGAGIFALPSVEANAAAVSAPENRVQIVSRRRRVVTRTRVTRVGRYRYRETIRTTYLPNGRIRTQVIRRVRLAGRAL